jgi:hypothetical protein
LLGRKAGSGQKNGSPSQPLDHLPTDLPCPDSQDINGDWVSLLVHNVQKLEREKDVLGQRLAQLEAELENAGEEIGRLKEKLQAGSSSCQLVLNFSLSDF